jgi:hypothetical protein
MAKNTLCHSVFQLFMLLAVAVGGVSALFLPLTSNAAFAVYTWDGGGTNDAWTSGANWRTEVSPSSDGNAEVRFSGAARKTPAVDGFNPWPLRKILFTSEATGQFILGGNPLSVAESISTQDQGGTPQTIDNNITFTAANPSIWVGYGKTLVFGGNVTSASPLLLRGSGSSTIQVAKTGTISVSTMEISAATAAYGNVTLQLNHSAALGNQVVLKLTPKSDGTKFAKINLNFNNSLAQVVGGLVLNGVVQPDGIYNATTHPTYFTGTGNLQVGNGGTRTVAISNWAEWGPSWGRAGLSVPRYNAEGMMAPQPGDIDNNSGIGRGMIEWRDVAAGTDGSLNFLNPEVFPRIAESRPTAAYEWAGMVEHLHTYMKANDTALVSGVLRVDSIPNPADLWLNGEPVATGQTIVLKPGWNRLMVKSRSPRTPDGQFWTSWSLGAMITNIAYNVQFRTMDPERLVMVTDDYQAFRYLSTVKRTDGDPPVFTLGTAAATDVTLRYLLQVGIGTASNYQDPAKRTQNFIGFPSVYSFDPARVARDDHNAGQAWMIVPAATWANYAPSQLHMRVRDDTGRRILDAKYGLSYSGDLNSKINATRDITLKGLKLGHYSVVTELLDPKGSVLARDNDHSFAVVVGAVNRSLDQKPRSLGVVGHWVLGAQRYPSRLRWMNRVGVTRQQKLWEGWDAWGPITFDGYGNITVGPAPAVEDALGLAQSLNIDVSGDLVEGYYQSGIANLDLPGNGQVMPTFGSIAWNNLFYSYGFQLANKYVGRIESWGGINEVDRFPSSATDAAIMHVEAARQIAAGMKAANPAARYVSSSLVATSRAQPLFNAGFLTIPDVVDVHSHPWRAPEPWETSLTPYSNDEGRTMLLKNGYTGPLIYGEMSAPRGHNPRGARGHAEEMVKQLVWAINWRDVSTAPVVGINYLVAYDAPDYWSYNMGFDNQYGDPLPIVNAANVAARLLDGRDVLPALNSLPAGISHIRVTNPSTQYPETVVVWKTNGQTTVSFRVASSTVRVVDLMGREQTYAVTGGQLTLPIDTTPQYVLGRFN